MIDEELFDFFTGVGGSQTTSLDSPLSPAGPIRGRAWPALAPQGITGSVETTDWHAGFSGAHPVLTVK